MRTTEGEEGGGVEDEKVTYVTFLSKKKLGRKTAILTGRLAISGAILLLRHGSSVCVWDSAVRVILTSMT